MINDVAVRASVEAEITGFEFKPRNIKEAMDFCDLMANSDLVPKDYRGKPGNIAVAIQMGAELGMSPMRSLRSIAVINGRASQWGDDMLAMVQASPVCEYVYEHESTDTLGVCRVKRRNEQEEHISTFSLEDAKRAGLLGKEGPWQKSTKRMLKLRARGFALRDKFADVLAGLITVEEAMDLPPIEPATPAETIVTANQPLTLKDKLKAKVEETDTAQPEQNTSEMLAEVQQAVAQGHASAPQSDDPAEPYRVKLRVCERTPQAITHAFNTIPEEIRQDCFAEYQAQLKSLGKKK